jgi:hypothetical protein
MGFYKKLKMQIDGGDTSAVLIAAQLCEGQGDLPQSLYWYRQAKKDNKVKELEEKIAQAEIYEDEDDDEDIFS